MGRNPDIRIMRSNPPYLRQIGRRGVFSELAVGPPRVLGFVSPKRYGSISRQVTVPNRQYAIDCVELCDGF